MEDFEIKFINFSLLAIIIYLSLQFFQGIFAAKYMYAAILYSVGTSYRKITIAKQKYIRGKREYLKTKKVLDTVKKNELRKLDADVQDWYLLKTEINVIS